VQGRQLVGRCCRLRRWMKRDHFVCCRCRCCCWRCCLEKKYLNKLEVKLRVCPSYSLAREAQRYMSSEAQTSVTHRPRYATGYLSLSVYIGALGIRNLRQSKQGSNLLAASYPWRGPSC
jgi:pimeloyl-CoA synthetase